MVDYSRLYQDDFISGESAAIGSREIQYVQPAGVAAASAEASLWHLAA
jgi:hypothetical protein